MELLETPEGKVLYTLYNLYKSNKITVLQRNELKDMLIQNDEKMRGLLDSYEQQEELELNILNLTVDLSPNDFDDQSSIHNSYKKKRPRRFFFHNSNFQKVIDQKKQSIQDSDSIYRNSPLALQSPRKKRIYSQIEQADTY